MERKDLHYTYSPKAVPMMIPAKQKRTRQSSAAMRSMKFSPSSIRSVIVTEKHSRYVRSKLLSG